MSSITGQYSPVSLYSPYQAGQGSSAVGPNNSQDTAASGAQNTFVLDPTAQDPSNPSAAQPTGSQQNSQNDLIGLQSSLGNATDVTDTTPQLPVSTTYSAPAPVASDDNDPNASFIDNQEASSDYQSMVLNLGQGNLAAAAKDYAQLQTDLKLHGQHHTGSAVSVDMNSSVDSAAGSVLNVTV